MAVMDRLTDKPEWHRKVFDTEIVSKWKQEAMAVPPAEWMSIASSSETDWNVEGWEIMSEEAFEFVSQPSPGGEGKKGRENPRSGLIGKPI